MTSKAQKEAQQRYDKKTKRIMIKYSIAEKEEYKRIEEHLIKLNISYQKYVKQLIRKDMETW